MTWASAADFFAMGGYGVYVWGSFGVTAACIALEIAVLAARRRGALRELPVTGSRADSP
ncbi:MAG TPA: heme exporter protein CcmD [Burkholderiales bacterium]|jgi:heme exporter protein D|nr:heme exporter protein CcmD [Burkholderiales bacterium]